MSAAVLISAFVFGLLLGSFANVCIWRIPRDISIVRPGSFCTSCMRPVPWYLNLPVLSYFILKGKCAFCGSGFSFRYPLIELLTALVTLSWFVRFGPSLTAGIFTLFGLALVIISVIDIDYQIIAPQVSYPLMGAGIIFAPLNGFLPSQGYAGIFHSAAGLIIGGFVIWLIRYAGTKALGKEAMGMGDVKLMMGIGAFIGPGGLFWTIFIGSLLGSIAGISMRIAGKIEKFEHIPFGPYLAAGAVIYINISNLLAALWLTPLK